MSHPARKRTFIDRQIQGALLGQIVRHWAIYICATFVILIPLEIMFGGMNQPFVEHVRTVFSRNAMLYLVALCLLPLFARDVIRLSHRWVGPVLRIRRELQRVANGEPLKPVSLRKDDFWHELAADFNAALAKMQRDNSAAATIESE